MQNHTRRQLNRYRTILWCIVLLWPLLCFAVEKPPPLQNNIIGIADKEMLLHVNDWLATRQWLHPTSIQQAHDISQEVAEQISDALEPFGYFNLKVFIKLQAIDQGWSADYQVTPGKRATVAQLKVNLTGEGKDNEVFKKLLDNAPLKEGQAFDTTAYSKLKQQLFELASQNGFLNASLQKSVKIDRQAETVKIALDFNTGSQYYFGSIKFSSTGKPVKHTFLRRFLPFKPGEPLHTSVIQKLQHDLGNSDLFRYVSITPQLQQANAKHWVPINVKVTPQSTYQYRFGLGYGTDTGLRALVGSNVRHIQSDGQQVKLLGTFSEDEVNFTADYLIPGKNPTINQYSTALILNHLKQRDQISNSIQLSLYDHALLWKWQCLTGINIINEEHHFNDGSLKNFRALYANIQLNRRITNDLIHPTKGLLLNFVLRGSSSAVLSNTSFFQTKLTAKKLLMIPRHNRLLLRGALGYTMIDNPLDLPTFLQFHTGGSQTVRGYAYHSIPGTNLPGNILKEASIEYQQHIRQNWYIGVFMDAGNVSGKLRDDFKRGAGLALIWLSPIGAMELSIAKGLDSPTKPWLLQFNMGPDL